MLLLGNKQGLLKYLDKSETIIWLYTDLYTEYCFTNKSALHLLDIKSVKSLLAIVIHKQKLAYVGFPRRVEIILGCFKHCRENKDKEIINLYSIIIIQLFANCPYLDEPFRRYFKTSDNKTYSEFPVIVK